VDAARSTRLLDAVEIERHCICGSVWQTPLSCEHYGMNSQVSFSGVSLFLSAKEITWPNAGKWTMPAPSRGGGDCVVKIVPIATRRKPSPCSVLVYAPLPPPKTITELMRGSKAAEAAYTREVELPETASPCITTISPGVVRIDVAQTTKQHYWSIIGFVATALRSVRMGPSQEIAPPV